MTIEQDAIDQDVLEDDLLDADEDPRVQLWEGIADRMAVLSESPEAPANIALTPSMFTPDEVDFETDAWMYRLSDVQGWLAFDSDLPTSTRDAFLEALVSELGLDVDSALQDDDGTRHLTVVAVEKLQHRVETAVRLRDAFLENREENGASLADATSVWADAWADEEDGLSEPDRLKPVSAKAAVWYILQLTKKKLNLAPSYQRGDVWRTGDRQALIESILRGIPLPSLILLRTPGATTHEVVDGKQRLTAILRFVGAHPRALAKVREADARHPGKNLKTLFETNYPAFRLAWKKLEKETLTAKAEDDYYFPFKLRGNGDGGLTGKYLEPLQGKYYTEIKDKLIPVSGQVIEVEELFTGAPDYQIPVIEYLDASQRQIHEVFKLYNKQGVHLNAEELRNAVYHEVTLMPATLYAAGDAAEGTTAADIADGVLMGVPGLEELGATLKAYGFGDSRYKRTKVLSWIIAVLLHDTADPVTGERKALPSTARHIDLMLDQVADANKYPTHRLRSRAVLADLFGWIAEVVELHSGHHELWAPSFKDGEKGIKWQELQLVGSVLGIAFAAAGAPDDIEDRIEEHADAIRAASATDWVRIEKAQTKSQWDYIARIATGIVDLLGVDPQVASDAVRERFGTSGFESLRGMIFPTAQAD
ncbi:MAG: DUF262 domain-containing protein [Corynebacterium sp.]|uniref:DUF262 domain-containing protein n=1 Tax=Corynebacterium sp. TaxID=1720 RepID=UPI0026DFF8B5|nr:DUF262 domain-containing protein [Corynebacterium sp.]MDO5670114.1 DUF262 domain-containing protein [Corynebacterium sp.]